MSEKKTGRDLFFTPTTGETATHDSKSEINTAADPPSGASDSGADKAASSTYTYPKPPPRERKYFDKEYLNAPIIQIGSGHNVPHFSLIEEETAYTNPVTGKSVNFGAMPWRCSDRVSDWFQSLSSFDGPSVHWHHMKLTYACSRSELGHEPIVPYTRLKYNTAMFYKERAEAGMMRLNFWERFPYSVNEMRAIGEGDAIKMRTWRQQRQLEEVAKRDEVDDLIRSTILDSERSRIDRAKELANPYTGIDAGRKKGN